MKDFKGPFYFGKNITITDITAAPYFERFFLFFIFTEIKYLNKNI